MSKDVEPSRTTILPIEVPGYVGPAIGIILLSQPVTNQGRLDFWSLFAGLEIEPGAHRTAVPKSEIEYPRAGWIRLEAADQLLVDVQENKVTWDDQQPHCEAMPWTTVRRMLSSFVRGGCRGARRN